MVTRRLVLILDAAPGGTSGRRPIADQPFVTQPLDDALVATTTRRPCSGRSGLITWASWAPSRRTASRTTPTAGSACVF